MLGVCRSVTDKEQIHQSLHKILHSYCFQMITCMSEKMYIIHLEDSCVVECSRFTLEAEVFQLMLCKFFAMGGKCVKFWFIVTVSTTKCICNM